MKVIPLRLSSPLATLMAGVLVVLAATAALPGQKASGAAINAAVQNYLTTGTATTVSLIIETKGDPAPVMQAVVDGGGRIETTMSVLNGFQATVGSDLANRLNHDSRIKRINLNAPIRFDSVDSTALANRYNKLSRVPAVAWNGKNLDGSGVQVAVIDSGVWPHNDLVQASSKVSGNGGNRLLSLYTNPLATDALDHVGHGTHVAGIVGGNGYDSGGQYMGVAPNSLIVSVKISNDLGSANEGDVISGLEWVYEANKHGMSIRVINLSLSSTVAQSYHDSALDAAVEKLWMTGVVVVTSAGNGTGAVQYAPGNDPFAITVGSIDDNYVQSLSTAQMAAWSMYGATQDGVQKPDVVADGSHVVSLLAPASSLFLQHTANLVGTSYFKMGGTSMAAPQVAGMVAMMLQANPSLSNNRVKRMLKQASVPFGLQAYTSWLGTAGGFLDASAIGKVVASDDNQGNTWSMSFNPNTGAFLAGGTVWQDANWAGASWNSTAWNNTAWNNTAWNNTAWNGTDTLAPVLLSPVWSTSSWASTAWNNASLDSTAWNNVSTDSTAWNNTAWNSTAWNNTAWNNTAWNNTAWNNTAWNNTAWNSIAWSSTAWNNTAWNNGTWQ